MIHLVNGESTLLTLRTAEVPGEKFSIEDIFAEGPILDGLQTESSWLARANYLERHLSIPQSEYLAGNATRNSVLRESLTDDEVVLWFEFDLHCQANLLYFLDWYGMQDHRPKHLSLVCPETFPGRDQF